MSKPFVTWAQSYIERGFSVVPIGPHSKVPGFSTGHLNNWEQYCKRQAAPWQIRQWMRHDPDCGIGLLGGYGGLIGLDVDHKDAYGPLREIIGHIKPPSKIGRKGVTGFFYDPTGLIESRSFREKKTDKPKRETLLDIIAGGRQTVIPPSIHPDTGKAYFWHNQSLEGLKVADLPVFTAAMLQQIEDGLAPLMDPKRVEAVKVRIDPSSLTESLQRRYRGWARAALPKMAETLATRQRPGRNVELYTQTCFMAPLIRSGFISATEVVNAFEEACRQNGLVRDNGEHDVRRTINRALANAKDELPVLPERERRAA